MDYFHKECYDVCMRRLEVLMDSNLDICAYNFTIFLIKRVFDPQNEFLEKDWLHGKRDNAYNILDLHLAILYRRKEDSSKLQYLVSIFLISRKKRKEITLHGGPFNFKKSRPEKLVKSNKSISRIISKILIKKIP